MMAMMILQISLEKRCQYVKSLVAGFVRASRQCCGEEADDCGKGCCAYEAVKGILSWSRCYVLRPERCEVEGDVVLSEMHVK